jgi:hypothetical protein
MGIYTSIFYFHSLLHPCQVVYDQKFACHINGLVVTFSTARILRSLKARIPGQENMRRFSTCLMQTKHHRPRRLDHHQVRVHGK